MGKFNPDDNPWKLAGALGVLGVDIALCTLVGYGAGAALSKRFGGYGWVVGGILAGLLVGIISAVAMIRRSLEDSDDQ